MVFRVSLRPVDRAEGRRYHGVIGDITHEPRLVSLTVEQVSSLRAHGVVVEALRSVVGGPPSTEKIPAKRGKKE